ncbi:MULTISPECIES: hypothetical protein [Photobacterium]|nr:MULTISPECIES: hypothetical protein [Photobacterium]
MQGLVLGIASTTVAIQYFTAKAGYSIKDNTPRIRASGSTNSRI